MAFTNLTPVSFQKVGIRDGFWKKRIHAVCAETARLCIDQCEKTHRIDNFRRAAGWQAGGHEGIYFNDSDVYKVLEGVAYSMKDCFATLVELGIAPTQAVAIGGGAKNGLWRQILADMLNIPLKTVENVDSSLGSAMLAGVAVGVFASHADAVERCVREQGVTLPDPEGVDFYNERFKLYKEIQAALAPIYHKL